MAQKAFSPLSGLKNLTQLFLASLGPDLPLPGPFCTLLEKLMCLLLLPQHVKCVCQSINLGVGEMFPHTSFQMMSSVKGMTMYYSSLNHQCLNYLVHIAGAHHMVSK